MWHKLKFSFWNQTTPNLSWIRKRRWTRCRRPARRLSVTTFERTAMDLFPSLRRGMQEESELSRRRGQTRAFHSGRRSFTRSRLSAPRARRTTAPKFDWKRIGFSFPFFLADYDCDREEGSKQISLSSGRPIPSVPEKSSNGQVRFGGCALREIRYPHRNFLPPHKSTRNDKECFVKIMENLQLRRRRYRAHLLLASKKLGSLHISSSFSFNLGVLAYRNQSDYHKVLVQLR